MNCKELQNEIEQLKNAVTEFNTAMYETNETGKGLNKVRKAHKTCKELEDSLLEKYLEDFREHNPELDEIELGERIEGFDSMYNPDYIWKDASIYSISPLPNGKVLIGGEDGALYEYDPDTHSLGRRIEGFNGANGKKYVEDADIYSISPLPNGKVLIGGLHGALYEYDPDTHSLGKRIEGLNGVNDSGGIIEDIGIYSISPLPNGKVLIGGRFGALYEYDPDTHSLGKRIEGFDGMYRGSDIVKNADIFSISPLPNGKVLIGGDYGALYEADVTPSVEGLKKHLKDIVKKGN